MDKIYYLANDIIEDTLFKLNMILGQADINETVSLVANEIIVKASIDLKEILIKLDNTGTVNNEAYSNIENLIGSLDVVNNCLNYFVAESKNVLKS